MSDSRDRPPKHEIKSKIPHITIKNIKKTKYLLLSNIIISFQKDVPWT